MREHPSAAGWRQAHPPRGVGLDVHGASPAPHRPVVLDVQAQALVAAHPGDHAPAVGAAQHDAVAQVVAGDALTA
jgi:hypothetical protein